MANLDGSHPNGARHEVETASALLSDPARLAAVYTVVLEAARAAGVDAQRLPDFLALGGGIDLAGQEELSDNDIEAAVGPRVGALAGEMGGRLNR